MILILPQASTRASLVPALSRLITTFTSPYVICIKVGILVKSQACQTKGVFEHKSGDFFDSIDFFCSMPLLKGKAPLPQPYMMLLYGPW